MTLLKDATTHLTLLALKPSCLATANATADSKPLPLLGLFAENHGAYAGESVATVNTPEVLVCIEDGEQPVAAADGPKAKLDPDRGVDAGAEGTRVLDPVLFAAHPDRTSTAAATGCSPSSM